MENNAKKSKFFWLFFHIFHTFKNALFASWPQPPLPQKAATLRKSLALPALAQEAD